MYQKASIIADKKGSCEGLIGEMLEVEKNQKSNFLTSHQSYNDYPEWHSPYITIQRHQSSVFSHMGHNLLYLIVWGPLLFTMFSKPFCKSVGGLWWHQLLNELIYKVYTFQSYPLNNLLFTEGFCLAETTFFPFFPTTKFLKFFLQYIIFEST